LSPLAECPELVGLDLSGCSEVRDLSALANAKKLEMLSLFGVPVERIEALAGCASLHTLELSRTGVKDLSPLADLKELRELYLRGLSLQSPGPISGLPELKTLDLTGTTFADANALADLRNVLNGKGVEIRPATNGQ